MEINKAKLVGSVSMPDVPVAGRYTDYLVLDGNNEVKRTTAISDDKWINVGTTGISFNGSSLAYVGTNVGSEIGEYNCKMIVEAGNSSNGNYRFTYRAEILFSLTNVRVGSIFYQRVSDLKVIGLTGIVFNSGTGNYYTGYDDWITITPNYAANSVRFLITNKAEFTDNGTVRNMGTIRVKYKLDVSKFTYDDTPVID